MPDRNVPQGDREPARKKVSDETRAAEVLDAFAEHEAPQVPTPEEEAAADRSAAEYDPAVGEAYEQYLDKAVGQEGEGRI
jgi:hypothetical protein